MVGAHWLRLVPKDRHVVCGCNSAAKCGGASKSDSMPTLRRLIHVAPWAVVLSIVAVSSNALAQCNGGRTGLSVKEIADRTVLPLMAKEKIPGMAVGVIVRGKPYVFNYGVASQSTKRAVGPDTLFEVGSISKTFTATLASYAQQHGYLSLSDKVGTYVSALRGSPFGNVTLLELGTHTVGTLPMQVPDGIRDDTQLTDYLKAFRSHATPGTIRVYSNVSIGMLGVVAAKAMGGEFATLMREKIFDPLGLSDTYIDIPADHAADYAQGYTRDGKPIRMVPGELWQESYGIRTTAADLTRFLQANMNLVALAPDLERALIETHTGYFKAGALTQDLIWEQYAYPVALRTLFAGTAEIGDAVPATPLRPPEVPRTDVWINKTGSTNGFAAYVAFVPAERCGIVLLANRSYPLAERVTAAYKILTALAEVYAG